MGKCTSVDCFIYQLTSNLHTFIIDVPFIVSQTVVYNFYTVTSINLHLLVNKIPTAMFECELFPALTISQFAPLHVNLFSTGKIVILGKDALDKCKTIINWLNKYIV